MISPSVVVVTVALGGALFTEGACGIRSSLAESDAASTFGDESSSEDDRDNRQAKDKSCIQPDAQNWRAICSTIDDIVNVQVVHVLLCALLVGVACGGSCCRDEFQRVNRLLKIGSLYDIMRKYEPRPAYSLNSLLIRSLRVCGTLSKVPSTAQTSQKWNFGNTLKFSIHIGFTISSSTRT